MLEEIGIIALKTYGVIVVLNILLVLFLVVYSKRVNRVKNNIRNENLRAIARDDQIFAEVERFHGTSW